MIYVILGKWLDWSGDSINLCNVVVGCRSAWGTEGAACVTKEDLS